MSSFFRFLSKRVKSSDNNHRHKKLNGCEDLKEALDNLNNRPIINNVHQQPSQPPQLQHNNLLNKQGEQQGVTINQRFLSFKSLKKYTQQNKKELKDSIECAVIFLDGSEQHFFIEKKSNADKLYEKVYYHLDLIETDYFGLQYTDTHNVQHWLDPTKCIRKQCKIGPPFTFFFKVKFYTADPNNLKEEITRYFYFLQLKNDLRTGKLPCSQQIAIELASLTLQEELGDYDSQVHTIETVSEFRFVPDEQQTEEFEEGVLKHYKTKCSNLTPAEAELTYLNKAKWLELYGVDMHSVYGRDQNEYRLGLTPSGILVFESDQKIGLFYWPKIEKVEFSKKKFTIIVAEDDDRGYKQEHTFIFHLIDEKACKHLWKCAVEYHAFFRLRSAPKAMTNGLNGFIRRGSRFRGPQRTEFQTTNLSISTRRSVHFERKPSQRFSRRASYAIKRKMHEQKMNINDDKQKESLIILEENATSLKEEAENVQARLKQIEIESDDVKVKQIPQIKQKTESVSKQQTQNGNCCKLQQANGGIEHDIKCNLFKAQQINNKAEALNNENAQACACQSSKLIDDERKNEAQASDDKIKLVDKDLISLITIDKKAKRNSHVSTTETQAPFLKESSFMGPTSLLISSLDNINNQQQTKPDVIITRTQSILNDRTNATAAYLHINGNLTQTKQPSTNQIAKPIISEL